VKLLFTQLLSLILISIHSYALPLVLSEQEKVYIQKNPIVTIGMMPQFATFSYIKHEKNIGFEHDLLHIISSKTGLQFDKKIGDWPKIYNAFKKSNLDMISSIAYTDYRSDFTLYTTPYYNIPVAIFIRDDYENYDGLKSLKGKKVGTIKNVFFLYKLKRVPELKLVYYESYEEIVNALFLGEIDALILNIPSVQTIIKKRAYTNIIDVERLTLSQSSQEDLRFGIQSKNALLHSIIQKGLDSISEEDYTKLSEKWLLSNYSKPIDYTFLFAIILGTIVFIGSILYLIMKKKNKELSQLSITDKLTNLYNRRKLEELIQTEINRSERFNYPFALVMLDLDYFKDVNDTHGHEVGDMVLIEIANLLSENLRKTDFVGRFGGEEFIIICPGIHESQIYALVESLRIKIADHKFEIVDNKTASFGITSFIKGDTLQSIIKRADNALYEAKNNGRNQSIINN